MDLQQLLDFHHRCNEESRQMSTEMEAMLRNRNKKDDLRANREGAVAYLMQHWLTSKDVEQALRISTRKLQSLRDKGELRFSKIGGDIYYQLKDIEALLMAGYTSMEED